MDWKPEPANLGQAPRHSERCSSRLNAMHLSRQAQEQHHMGVRERAHAPNAPCAAKCASASAHAALTLAIVSALPPRSGW